MKQLPSPGHRLRILVVDDDRAVREALKFALELEGLAVEIHASGQALLSAFAPADCLVLDYRLPGMDGLSVLAALARRGVRIPTILITAPVTELLRRAACRAGAFAVLEKPLTGGVLMENIQRAVRA